MSQSSIVPTAVGFGAGATGGRGGQVLTVTSSADSGPGSLRWALEQSTGPRTIVFEVGEVRLDKNIKVSSGDVTIAGQTAGSVQISGGTMKIQASNVIVQGMAFRPGDAVDGPDPANRDGLQVGGTGLHVHDVLIDRNSFQWAVDENVSFWGHVTDATFSNNIVAQGLSESLHPKGEHSTGLLITAAPNDPTPERITIVDNLFAFNAQRNPRITDGLAIEVVNNYVYAPGDNATSMFFGQSNAKSRPFSANVAGNFHETGPQSWRTDLPPIFLNNAHPDTKIRVADNLVFDASGRQLDAQSHGKPPTTWAGFAGSGVAVDAPANAKEHVLTNAGAAAGARDAIDQRVIDLILDGTGGLVDSVAEAGGWGGRPSVATASDTDRDGVPDWFERTAGTDVARWDPHGDADRNGRTNLEDYLDSLLFLSSAPPTGGDQGGGGSGDDLGPRTGSGLDAVIDAVASDPVLAWKLSDVERTDGATAAAGLNAMILDGIRTLGLGDDGSLTRADIIALNGWLRDNPARIAEYASLYGVAGATETGFQLLHGEGSTTQLFGVNAINTVFGSVYQVGFALQGDQFAAPSGVAVSTWTITDRLSRLLADDLDSGRLVSGAAPDFARTGTGLDAAIDVIQSDPVLAWKISALDSRAGAEAAAAMNAVIVDGIRSLGLADDEAISWADVIALNDWIRADAARAADYERNYGQTGAVETGFRLVEQEGATTSLFGVNALNTLFASVYQIGFRRSGDDFLGPAGGTPTSTWQVRTYLDRLLEDDFASGTLRSDPSLSPKPTGTGLDRIFTIIEDDPVLSWKISAVAAREAQVAAAGLNSLIVEGLLALDVVADGAVSIDEVAALNAWIRGDAGRLADFSTFYGGGKGADETGFALVLGDEGATTTLFGVSAVNSVYGGLYQVGFRLEDGRFYDADGGAGVSVWTVRQRLSQLLDRELDDGSLGVGAPAPPAAPRSEPTARPSATGLDVIERIIVDDPVLAWSVSDEDRSAGIEAAAALNAIIVDGIQALDLAHDGVIGHEDVLALNAWVRADRARADRFDFLRGEEGVSGYQLVEDHDAKTTLDGENAVNTVFGSIYELGLDIQGDRFIDDGAKGASTWQVARYLDTLLDQDIDSGGLL